MAISKRVVKQILGDLPLTAELYWQVFQRGMPVTRGFSLRKTERALPLWRMQAEAARKNLPAAYAGRRILIFCTLRYWIEHGALLGAALSGLGHEITLAYLPYASVNRQTTRFDVRRHNAYTRSALKESAGLFQTVSLWDVHPTPEESLPAGLVEAVEQVSLRDTQYTLQIEDVERDNLQSPSGRLFHLRHQRNLDGAAALLGWFQALRPEERPELLLTPNGSILEMGAIYQTARHLGIPAVTYEFGEQRGRIWLARNSEVMLQETDDLWETYRDCPLTESQWEQIRSLYASRQNGRLWENFSRLWQGLPSQGGEQVRRELGLDARPIVLLAANVIGDSLTLGRQIFSKNMTEWLERSVQYFADRPDIQLVVRIHPGERYLKGPSVAQVVRNALPNIPEHIHLIEAADPVNTYDLLEIADVGLAYTTTVGMEMAMSGVPAIIGGKTHYRLKGFTLDPTSWENYHALLGNVLANPRQYRLTREQVEQAWNYAYRFFFDYPCPFPWHMLNFWNELETWSLERVLSSEGQAVFGDTFQNLAGEPRRWTINTQG
jgi:hypothetical protein